MNERFIYLIEKYFDNAISGDEEQELNNFLLSDPIIKQEFEEQKIIKVVLNKMKMKNPSSGVWDSYWLGIYRKIERGFAWIAISIGAIVLFAYGIYHTVENFLRDTTTPVTIKWGITLLFVGVVILLISLIREKIFTSKRDKYKEIQR